MNFIPQDGKTKTSSNLFPTAKYLICVISIFGRIFYLTVLILQVAK